MNTNRLRLLAGFQAQKGLLNRIAQLQSSCDTMTTHRHVMRFVAAVCATQKPLRGECVLDPNIQPLWLKSQHQWHEKSSQITSLRRAGDSLKVRFSSNPSKEYAYGPGNYYVPRSVREIHLNDGDAVSVDGKTWGSVTALFGVDGPDGDYVQIQYTRKDGSILRTIKPAERISVSANAAADGTARQILDYFKEVVRRLPDDDHIKRHFTLDRVDEDSALAAYLTGNSARCADEPEEATQLIFPFSANASQQEAVARALSNQVSVIQGPPGTGKTQTIVNLVASILLQRGKTVAVVSHTNAAVDNVAEKLDKAGLGFVCARVGNKEVTAHFAASRVSRENALRDYLSQREPDVVDDDTWSATVETIGQVFAARLDRARDQSQLRDLLLEQKHFQRYLEELGVAPGDAASLDGASAKKALTYLVDQTRKRKRNAIEAVMYRLRCAFWYGKLTKLDVTEFSGFLAVQQHFYAREIARLEARIDQLNVRLNALGAEELDVRYRELSKGRLSRELRDRYSGVRDMAVEERQPWKDWSRLTYLHPVILTTLHALPQVLRQEKVDYLIVDEASQVNLPQAVLALARCQNLVIVGDDRQLPPVLKDMGNGVDCPDPRYDVTIHSLLTSAFKVFGDHCKPTLLKEHYRCPPAIIEYCNQSFYGGALVCMTDDKPDRDVMSIVRSAPGNHMRKEPLRGGGAVNQREADDIAREVEQELGLSYRPDERFAITPYVKQTTRINQALDDGTVVSTVHKTQGRETKLVILSTVIDESKVGGFSKKFVDDPQLINVAVSRAQERLVVFTHHNLLTRTKHLRRLVDYIIYQNPQDNIRESPVVGVFDLLYREYSTVLQNLDSKLPKGFKYRSEAIGFTLINEILADEEFTDLTVACEVRIRHLLPSLEGLPPDEAQYVDNGCRVDFMIYEKLTRVAVLAVEVDGHAFHRTTSDAERRDRLKNSIFERVGLPLLRLPTDGSGEETKIRNALRNATPAPGGYRVSS